MDQPEHVTLVTAVIVCKVIQKPVNKVDFLLFKSDAENPF